MHLKSLGVTHLQLLPFSDFVSVDEERLGDPAYRALRRDGAFNWGYDPGNYDSPEGSYSSVPSDGQSRVRELKALVMAAGDAGLGVIMDVVYNHVPEASRSPLGLTVPGYFFRAESAAGASASGAGDDTASERPMMRRFMIASLERWLGDYRLSGFRFDLMGLHDVGTMRAVESALRRIKGDVLLYGEGWDLYRGAAMRPASQPNIRLLERQGLPCRPRGIGMFNDAFRDGIKGSVFDARDRGFIHGGKPGAGRVEGLKFGIVGATRHPGVDNGLVAGTAMPRPWTGRTASSVNYVEIHDNLTLFDKNQLAAPGLDDGAYRALQRLGLGLVLLAEGMPVLHSGGEFMRTKELP
ncbi:MAG: type I pullulanase, partial [Spirochaetota bacterium]